MTANATRGEVSLKLGEQDYILRPSFEALVAIEKDTGEAVMALARAAEAGGMSITTAAQIVTHLIRAQGKAIGDKMLEIVNADRIGRLIMESDGGLLKVLLVLRLALYMAVTGGFTPEGEVKAITDNGKTPTAN